MENEGNNAGSKDSVSRGQELESMDSSIIPPSINMDTGAVAGQPIEAAGPGGGRKKAMLFILTIFLVIIGVMAFYFITKANPAEVLKASMSETAKVKTYSFSGIFNYSTKVVGNKNKLNESSKTEVNTDVKVEMSGKQDITDAENPKSDQSVKIEAGLSGDGGSQKFSADMNIVSLGQKKAYYKLNSYDLGIVGLMYGEVLSPFKGKWYYVDVEKLAKMSPAASADSLELNKKMIGIYGKYDFFKFKKDLGNDKVGDTAVYHYEVSLDRKAIMDFYIETLQEYDNALSESGSLKSNNNSYLEEFKNNVDRSSDLLDEAVNNIKTEVWIGKKDKIVRRIKMNADFDEKFYKIFEEKMKEFSPLGASSSSIADEVSATMIFGLDFSLSDINTPVVIEEPAGAGDLMEALFKAMGNLFSKQTVTSLDTDKDGLSDNLERIYKTDLNNSDTDGDGYKDGDEIKNGFDPLNKAKGAKLK